MSHRLKIVITSLNKLAMIMDDSPQCSVRPGTVFRGAVFKLPRKVQSCIYVISTAGLEVRRSFWAALRERRRVRVSKRRFVAARAVFFVRILRFYETLRTERNANRIIVKRA